MVNIIDHLYLGSDKDHEEALAKGWAILVAAKAGPWGHQMELGYTTHGAPKDKTYYSVRRGKVLHLNLIDPDNPHLIAAQAINDGLDFIKEYMDADKDILVHCNEGHSRGPSLVLAYLRTIGEMPSGYMQSQKKFKTIYPPYDPHPGIDTFMRDNWRNLLYTGKTKDVGSKKFTKEEVQYEEHATMKHFCKDCTHFEAPNGCEIVQGLINPTGWCNKWAKK